MNPKTQLLYSTLCSEYLLRSNTLYCPSNFLNAEELSNQMDRIKRECSKLDKKISTITIPEEIIKLSGASGLDFFKTNKGSSEQIAVEQSSFGFETVLGPCVAIYILYSSQEEKEWTASFVVGGGPESYYFFCKDGEIQIMDDASESVFVNQVPPFEMYQVYYVRKQSPPLPQKKKRPDKEKEEEEEEEKKEPKKKKSKKNKKN